VVFSSPVFLFAFLPMCLVLYQVAPRAWRNTFLLIASLVFYAWGERAYAAVMLVSIGVNFFAGRAIARTADERRRKRALTIGVVVNLLLLAGFKYAGWLSRELHALGTALGLSMPDAMAELGIHLPIGISFFTFQAISYLVDLFRGHADPQRKPVDFALYVALFPQLIAGPIVRYADVARQIRERKERIELFASGVQRFVLGLGKKVLIANTLAVPADRVFDAPGGELSAAAAWLGLVCFMLQVYFDFSGYSDMAIGLGRMFGFRFRENFLHPYESRSISELWRRWHVSLGSWLRDYVYLPLGGSRRGAFVTYRNLIFVFVLCGVWHGAAWTFVLFGLAHGLLLSMERALRGKMPSGVLGHVYAMFAFAMTLVIFRANDMTQAFAVYAALFGAASPAGVPLAAAPLVDGAVVAALVAGVIGSTRMPARLLRRLDRSVTRGRVAWRFAGACALLALLGVSAAELASGSYNPFLYFRF
jgi:alginate O-acetyltransferase complex protein AlgI